MCDLLTDAIVGQIRRARAQAEPHLASVEEIARFRAVRMAREGLAVGLSVVEAVKLIRWNDTPY